MRRPHPSQVFVLAYFMTGAFTMGCEVVWARLLALVVGSQSAGIYAILAAVFAGMGVGAMLVNPWVRRTGSPVRLFAVLQALASLYALLSPACLHRMAVGLPPILGPALRGTPGVLGAFTVACAAMLPGTALLGAAFAAIVEASRRASPEVEGGMHTGRLYAANVCGGILGIGVTVYLALPRMGVPATTALLAAVGFVSALLVCPLRSVPAADMPARRSVPVPDPPIRRVLHAALFLVGLGGIGLQVVGIHLLQQILANTIFTFAHVTASCLLGATLGASLYTRWGHHGSHARAPQCAPFLLALAACTVWISGWVLAGSALLHGGIAVRLAGMGGQGLAEAIVAMAAFLLPTMAIGACYSHLVGRFTCGGVGLATASNLAGCTLAPFLFGVILSPIVPSPVAFRVLYAFFVIASLACALAFHVHRRWRVPGVAAAVLGAMLLPSSFSLVPLPHGFREIARHEGAYGVVLVSESDEPARSLRSLQVNRFHMGGRLAFGEHRMGHIPLLLRPSANSALFLGVGTGSTLGAVRTYPLRRIDAVEVVPEVLECLPYFDAVNTGIRHDERVNMIVADARRFVAASTSSYDVVVADLYHPARDGANALYAREHFDAIRRRLSPGGLFVQWIPLYQVDPDTLRIIVRTYLDVFPHACSFLGLYNVEMPVLALAATADGEDRIPPSTRMDPTQMRRALARSSRARAVISGVEDVLGSFMLGSEALRGLAADAPISSDLHPHILFAAPLAAGMSEAELGRRNMRQILDRREPVPASLLGAPLPAPLLESSRRYGRALADFLEAELLRAGRWDRATLDACVPAYLDVYGANPRFRPTLGVLLTALQHAPGLAPHILPRLYRATPDDPLIRRAAAAYRSRQRVAN